MPSLPLPPCTQAFGADSGPVSISMHKVSSGDSFQDCSVQSICRGAILCANAFFSPHCILPPFCERRSCSGNLILFLNLHQFFPVVVTWPSTELLPIYTSACEMTIRQSASLLDFWKEWPCWGIPEAKNVISVGKASFTPVCTGRIEFTSRSKNHYLTTSPWGACLSQFRNSFESWRKQWAMVW